jgi:hypothetical protein
MTPTPKSAIAAIVSGITIPRSRTTDPQERHESSRSSFSPVEKSATMTANSARRMTISASPTGSSQGISKPRMTTAATRPSAR